MASGDSGKWPSPVTFDDNVPKHGFAKVHLKIPELKVKGFFGEPTAKNADVKTEIAKDKVCITVAIHGGDTYIYDKVMPEDIKDKESKCKLKNGKVEVILCKEKDISWGSHARDMIKKTKDK